jgi:hypothetical protein
MDRPVAMDLVLSRYVKAIHSVAIITNALEGPIRRTLWPRPPLCRERSETRTGGRTQRLGEELDGLFLPRPSGKVDRGLA